MTDKNDDKDDKKDKAPPKQKAALGRIVHYALSEEDVERIRVHYVVGECQPLSAGDLVAALVTRVHHGESCNMQLFIDGDMRYEPRVCSAIEGTEPGTWRWPAKV